MQKLTTKRLSLIPFTLDIVKVAIRGNDELGTYLGVDVAPEWNDEEFRDSLPFIADILCNYTFQNEWGWGSLIIHQADNKLIGHIMVKVIPNETGLPSGALEIGYYVACNYRQQGYASEATQAVVNWALCQPSVQKVTAGCDSNNLASKRVLEKIGMQLVDSRRNMLIWSLSKTAIVK